MPTHTHTCLSMWHIHTNCNDNLAKAFAGGKKYSSELKICASEEWWARGGSCFKLLSDRALCCRFFSASCLTSTVRLLIATHLLHTFPMQLLHIFKRCCCNSCCNCTVTHGTVVTPAVWAPVPAPAFINIQSANKYRLTFSSLAVRRWWGQRWLLDCCTFGLNFRFIFYFLSAVFH